VGVSALAGDGIDTLFEAIDASKIEFKEVYLPELVK
jgi:hypothetical protein